MLRREQRHNHPRRPRWKIVGREGKVNPTVSEVESQSNQTQPHVTTMCASHIPKSPDENRCRMDKEKNQKRKEANSPFFSPPPSSFFFVFFPFEFSVITNRVFPCTTEIGCVCNRPPASPGASVACKKRGCRVYFDFEHCSCVFLASIVGMNSKENLPEPGPSSGRSYAAAAGNNCTSPSAQPWWKYQTRSEEEAMRIALKRSWKGVEVRSRNFAKNNTELSLSNMKHWRVLDQVIITHGNNLWSMSLILRFRISFHFTSLLSE